MNARLKLLGAVLRKDLRLFWLLAAFTAGLDLLVKFGAIERKFDVSDDLLGAALFLATTLFILLVVHEDSVVTGKRDWVTRPVPGMTMLGAKCVLVVLVIVLPEVLGSILIGFHLGRPPVEVLFSSVAGGLGGAALLLLLCTLAFAALTSGIRQAIVAFLVCIVMLVFAIAIVSGGVVGFPPALWFSSSIGAASGSYWILTRTLELLVTFTALAVLWLLYRRRHGRRAALVLIGAAVLAGCTLIATMNWSRMFALQKWLSPDPAAASSVAVSLLPGCFPARTLEATIEPVAGLAAKIPVGIFSYQQRELAGAGAVAFAVRLVADHMPEDGQLLLNRTQLTYSMSDGRRISLEPGRSSQQWVRTESGQRAMDQYWLLSKNDYQQLAADPGTTAHLDYSLSLLEPRAAAVFAADGERAFRAGIGYCGATVKPNGGAFINCYRAGDQPALLAVRLEGQSDIEDRPSSYPDFTPAILDFWGGRRHYMNVAGADARQVQVTAYEARVHFTRQFDVPGVLGGPLSACPLP